MQFVSVRVAAGTSFYKLPTVGRCKNRRFLDAVAKDVTKYMVMPGDETARRSHSMKIDNSSFERAEEFKYLGTTLTNQTSIQVILRAY
jgi:hypothetical protein